MDLCKACQTSLQCTSVFSSFALKLENEATLPLKDIAPRSSQMSPEDPHKPIRIYIGGLILGVNTWYMFFCFFKLFAGYAYCVHDFFFDWCISQEKLLVDVHHSLSKGLNGTIKLLLLHVHAVRLPVGAIVECFTSISWSCWLSSIQESLQNTFKSSSDSTWTQTGDECCNLGAILTMTVPI